MNIDNELASCDNYYQEILPDLEDELAQMKEDMKKKPRNTQRYTQYSGMDCMILAMLDNQ